MRKLLIALLSACSCLPAFATAPAGYTTIISSLTTDASGAPLASGTATFQVVDTGGRAMSVKLSGGGQIVTAPVTVPVVNGVFTANVIDVSQSQPSFPCVVLTITNNVDGTVVWQNSCLQPVGSVYDLDQFSTNNTPVFPQAGDVVAGNLGVNGDLNITGTLRVGAFQPALIAAQSTNGVMNASLYSGADILAKAQSAFSACAGSSSCTIFIPAGSYSAATTLTLPNTQSKFALIMDDGAVITYTGTGDAIEGPTITGGANHDDLIQGGWIIGTVNGKNGIRINPINHLRIVGTKTSGFTSAASQMVGNGILDAGGNSIEIEGVSSFGNMTGIGGTEVTSYASIAVHIRDSDLSSNLGWGIATFDSHVSSTQENSWMIEATVFEGNGAGGIDLAHSNNAEILANHFEQSGIPIRLNNGYNGTNNKAIGNFFISGSNHSYQIQVVNGFNTQIEWNYETLAVAGATPSACFLGLVNTQNVDEQFNTIASTAETCYPGTTPGWNAQFNSNSTLDAIVGHGGGAVGFPNNAKAPCFITNSNGSRVCSGDVPAGGNPSTANPPLNCTVGGSYYGDTTASTGTYPGYLCNNGTWQGLGTIR